MTSKYVITLTSSISKMIPCNRPIKIIFYWFTMRNWIGDHCKFHYPIRSHVCLGRTFASNPRSRITWSISNSLICTVNLISQPILFLFPYILFTTWCSIQGFYFPTQLSINSCNPSIAFLFLNNLHVYRKDFKIVESKFFVAVSSWFSCGINDTGFFNVQAPRSRKIFFASMKVSFSLCIFNLMFLILVFLT